MDILLFGATGMIGSRIAAEALSRDHSVTAVTRSGGTPAVSGERLTVAAADAGDAAAVADLAAGRDVVASAVSAPRDGSDPIEPFLAVNRALADGVRASGTRRLVVVGGAGSLLTDSGVTLSRTPGFPDAYVGEAMAHERVLDFYRTVDDLDWTYISPAPEIAPGERTGAYREGGDRLIEGAGHASRISAEDYAVAFVDELEKGDAVKRRIAVAY